jgi:hypothetical protein
MESADFREVMKRLAEAGKPLLDERHREFEPVIQDDRKGRPTQCSRPDSPSVVEST